jgi:hypothetical protein
LKHCASGFGVVGDVCEGSSSRRLVTIDVLCDNVRVAVVSAQETSKCNHHIVMRSYFGCPKVSSFTLTNCVQYGITTVAIGFEQLND